MGRVFNALWRESFASSRRRARVCGEGGGDFAVVTLAGGVEVMGRLDDARSLETLSTSPPYYVRFRQSGSIEELTDADQLAALLPAGPDSVSRLCEEVGQSVRNMAIFLERSDERLGELPGRPGQGALARAFGRARFRGCRPEEYIESWVLRGHALHPGAKTRLGFSAADVERYSPELGRQVGLRFMAVRKTHLVDSRSVSADSSYPAAWAAAFEDSFRRRSLPSSDFEVLPVHPWQWSNVLKGMFKAELERGVLVPLDAVVEAQPLASLRTLAPLGDLHAPQLKLPLAIQATSVPRTITPPTVENSPRLADLLGRILDRTPDLARLVSLSPETRGAHFQEPGAPADAEKSRHLTMLLRRRPERRPGTWLVPNVVLAELSPLDGRPFVSELVERAGGDALSYFRDYVLLSSRVTLGLLARFGLGIEAHAQNTLTYHRRGTPADWVLRDFGGMRIDRRRLREAGLDVELHPGTLMETRDDLELVSSFHHCLLQGNLAPLAGALAGAFGVPEAELWRAGREAARAAWEEQRAFIGGERGDELGGLLFRPRVVVKALTRMRLSDEPWRDEFCEVENPLADTVS